MYVKTGASRDSLIQLLMVKNLNYTQTTRMPQEIKLKRSVLKFPGLSDTKYLRNQIPLPHTSFHDPV